MPKLTAEGIEPAMIVSRANPVLGIEVLDVSDLGVLKPLARAVIARWDDTAERASKREKLIVVERLTVEDRYSVAVDRVSYRADRLCTKRSREIDAVHFGDKNTSAANES